MKHPFYSLLAAAVLVPALTLTLALASHQAFATAKASAAHKHVKHNSAGQPVEGRLNEDMSPEHGFASNNEPNGTGANGRGGNEWKDSLERSPQMQREPMHRQERMENCDGKKKKKSGKERHKKRRH